MFTAGAALLLAACGTGGGDHASGADSAAATAQPADTQAVGGAGTGSMEEAAAPMSDNTIFATMASANEAEIDAGRAALERASDTTVRAFAGDMVREHSRLQRQADQLATKLELAPQPLANDTIQAKAVAAETALAAARGGAFDREYVRGRVSGHANTLRMLKGAEAAAASPELKALIGRTIPVVERHLARARELQVRVGGGA
jgi:putative membrane protein